MSRLALVAGVLLLQLVLLSGCATVSSGQAGTGTNSAISVVPLADGRTRVDIATDAAFDYGSAVLRPAFAAELSQIMKAHHQHPVRVSGYTDNVGAAAYNLDLSQRRAQAIADVLLAQGFSAAHLSVNGYGEASPVGSNADAAGRYRNRRVELLIAGDG